MRSKLIALAAALWFIIGLSGCASMKKALHDEGPEINPDTLRKQCESQLSDKDAQIAKLQAEIEKLKQTEIPDLVRAKADLESKLKQELADYKAKLEMTERGLVVTFLAEVFFDSGKDVIKEKGKEALNKVAQVLNSEVASSPVAIEGHTDIDPIKYSGWKSNWELSSGRALAVLHYFVDSCNVDPKRLSANAYGEYHPVAGNDTKEGKQKNRRVEIVILPPLKKNQN